LQGIGIHDNGHILVPGGTNDAGYSVVHERIAAESWADNEDMQTRQHFNDA
jgi:hypothetical protein